MESLHLTKDTLVNWSLLPQVELVSNSEDNMEVAMAKVRVTSEGGRGEEAGRGGKSGMAETEGGKFPA